jgi:ABC-type branched-subunit amino acid transport system substrate-binding protein
VFLQWTARRSLAGLALLGAFGGGVATACGGGGGGGGTAAGKLPKTLKTGVIVPTSGIGQFLGDIVDRSLRAAKRHIEDAGLFKGAAVDYVVVNAPAERLAEGANHAYNELVGDPDVIGILWCTPFGLRETAKQIQRDNMPVIAVYDDPWSGGRLYPDGPERSIFQLLLPDRMSLDALCSYAARDRGYETTALIYDSALLGDAREQFETAARENGLTVTGVEEFTLFSGDYGAQLQRLKSQRPQCMIVWGLSDNTAGIIKGLRDLDADYIDTPTAKSSPGWRPQILGYPGGTGEKKWAELAGDAAKAGTLTAWYLGGLVGGPEFAIRDWLVKYQDVGATGGEEGAPNGWWALLEAVRKAGSTDRRKMVTALEGLTTRFAGLEYGFTPKRHLAMTDDDVVLISLERYTGPVTTEPPYALGREWKETFPLVRPDYVGPAHLVRPTLEANRRAAPDYMNRILEEGWGTQCTKSPPTATGSSVTMTNACKIH